jgi:hypothetical protein
MVLDVRRILFPEPQKRFLHDIARTIRIAENARCVAQQPVLVLRKRGPDEGRCRCIKSRGHFLFAAFTLKKTRGGSFS